MWRAIEVIRFLNSLSFRIRRNFRLCWLLSVPTSLIFPILFVSTLTVISFFLFTDKLIPLNLKSFILPFLLDAKMALLFWACFIPRMIRVGFRGRCRSDESPYSPHRVVGLFRWMYVYFLSIWEDGRNASSPSMERKSHLFLATVCNDNILVSWLAVGANAVEHFDLSFWYPLRQWRLVGRRESLTISNEWTHLEYFNYFWHLANVDF